MKHLNTISINEIKSFDDYQMINEKKWHWWLLFGALAFSVLTKRTESDIKYDKYNITKSDKTKIFLLKHFSNLEEVSKYDKLIKNAKNDAIEKVRSSSNIKNKEEIIELIKKIKVVKHIEILTSYDPCYVNLLTVDSNINKDFFIKSNIDFEYIFIDTDFLVGSNEFITECIRHELFHLVDVHKLLNEEPNLKINTSLSKEEYDQIYSKIVNKEFKVRKDSDLFKYLSSKQEIYARLNNLKWFLYKIGKIKNPNNNITNDVWTDIYSGSLYESISHDKDLINEFENSDFLQILPFIKNANLDEINKLAYISPTELDNIA